jgi:hypothetical protein
MPDLGRINLHLTHPPRALPQPAVFPRELGGIARSAGQYRTGKLAHSMIWMLVTQRVSVMGVTATSMPSLLDGWSAATTSSGSPR